MNTQGYFVKTQTTETNPRVNELLNELKDLGFIDLPEMRTFHHATNKEFVATTRKLKSLNKNERTKEYRKNYLAREDVKARLKAYNAREDVKNRKKELQRRRSASITKLRNLHPNLYTQLVWGDNEERTEIRPKAEGGEEDSQ
jgi:hypothetical protein